MNKKYKIFESILKSPNRNEQIITIICEALSSCIPKSWNRISRILTYLINNNYSQLKKECYNGLPEDLPSLRALIWKINFKYLPKNIKKWDSTLNDMRKQYKEIKEAYLTRQKEEIKIYEEIEKKIKIKNEKNFEEKFINNNYTKEKETEIDSDNNLLLLAKSTDRLLLEMINKDIIRTHSFFHFFSKTTNNNIKLNQEELNGLNAHKQNLIYQDFKQVYTKGDYRPSSDDEILPIQENYLTGSIVGKNARDIFYEAKGVIENMARYCHMEDVCLEQIEKPQWADINAYLNITKDGNVIGSLGLLSVQTMNESKIKRTNAVIFEINMDKLVPYDSRTNKYEKLPELPLVEKDLSILVDEEIKWSQIRDVLRSKVKEIEFVDEYRGNQVPENKKSITLKVKLLNEGTTMTSEEINNKMNTILKTLNKTCGAVLREG